MTTKAKLIEDEYDAELGITDGSQDATILLEHDKVQGPSLLQYQMRMLCIKYN